jgi:hypothetical protein
MSTSHDNARGIYAKARSDYGERLIRTPDIQVRYSNGGLLDSCQQLCTLAHE